LLNTRSRIAVAVLAAGLLAAAGCSTKASNSSGGGSAGASVGGIKTGTGVTADTISVGELTDLSGPFAALGKSITQAQQLYYDQISAAGGVCGHKSPPSLRTPATTCSPPLPSTSSSRIR